MAGKPPPNSINLFQVIHSEKQFFASGSGLENINRGINPLIADLSIQHHFHISSTLELLENEFIHFRTGFDQGSGHNRERSGFFGISSGSEKLAWNFHCSGIHTAAHGAAATGHRVIESTANTGKRIHQHKDIFSCFHQPLGTLDRELSNASVALDITVV